MDETKLGFAQFKESFDREGSPDKKIEKVLHFMREVLEDESGKRFQDFWNAKKLCAPLFKESINPTKRHYLWKEYEELSIEAKQVRDIQDEQVEFAAEQIQLAIDALEADIHQFEKLLSHLPKITFPKEIQSFLGKQYDLTQRELTLLKTLIDRLTALRNEVSSLQMRIGPKAKILKRLSKMGDSLFPKRKQLQEQLSAQFLTDVSRFINERCSPDGDKTPYYVIRKEISYFQKAAKQLSLSPRTFKETRMLLNSQWDVLEIKDQERRKALEEQQKEEEKYLGEIQGKLQEFDSLCNSDEDLSSKTISNSANKLLEEIKALPLTHKTRRNLEGQVDKSCGAAFAKIAYRSEKEKEQIQKQVTAFNDALLSLVEKAPSLPHEELAQERSRLWESFDTFGLQSGEAHEALRKFTEIEGHLLDKQEGKRLSQDAYEVAFEARFSLTEKIKKEMEDYRKEMGGSGLDFQRAMVYRELYDSAKNQLDKELEALELLEEKFDSQ